MKIELLLKAQDINYEIQKLEHLTALPRVMILPTNDDGIAYDIIFSSSPWLKEAMLKRKTELEAELEAL